MTAPNKIIGICMATALIFASGCANNQPEEMQETMVQTPVTVTTISTDTLSDFVELNAISTYLLNSYIKSPAVGYVQKATVKTGELVKAGQVVFILQTKEARALGNTINSLDPSFNFSGIIPIRATETGYITSVEHQVGDYVQDGDQLAVLSNAASFGFLLNLPYEMRPLLDRNKGVDVLLPDNTILKGTVARIMPTVDSVSQTQQVLVRVHGNRSIPQNLIARVRLIRQQATSAISVPKEAILTDEEQRSFWVMKMIDLVTAVKVPITKGMESKDRVQILSPTFTPADKLVLTGNYGLPDTARVSVAK